MLKNLNSRSYNKPKRATGKILLRIFIILIILVAVIFFPVRSIYQSAKQLQTRSKALAAAYSNQNFGQLVSEVSGAKGDFQTMDSSLNLLFWLRFIPFIGGYYADSKAFVSAGVEETSVFEKVLTDLKPQEEELGFLGKPIAGQDRISQAIKILEKVNPLLSSQEPRLKKAKEEVENIDTNKYPEEYRGIKVRQAVTMAKNIIVGSYLATTQNKDALEAAPNILGQSQPKNYLMLFQNDKEIRATGGFLTAFASLKLDRGQVTPTASDDIYRLDERLLATCQSKICPLAPPVPIVKYLPEVTGKPRTAWSMRDSNLSPDLPTSAAEFERMFKLLGQGLPFDGIIYIDSQVVEDLIDVTGPIDIYDTPYSSKIDPRCNCPNVIFELENYSEIAAKGTQDRKAILGVLMQQILAKAIGTNTEKLPELIDKIVSLANAKHIMFYMHDDNVQKALMKLNWTGQIKDFNGDYLHINDSNFAGGKSNLYVNQVVTQEINTKNGTTTKKITLEYKNPQPFNTWLNGINRDYVRFYVPEGSKLISSKGSDDPVNTSSELGKTVFDAFITVRPQNSRKLEIEYSTPYNSKDNYKLMIQKQPGAKDFHYIIKLNGKQVEDFYLDSDKQFSF